MSIVPIITVPDDRLTKKCKKVKKADDETKQIAQNLVDTVRGAKNPEGAGLAAPQIGILKRICVARRFFPNPDPTSEQKTLSKEQVLINPKIVSKSREKVIGWEGCLSIPDIYGQVKRHKKIKIKALDENGKEIRETITGFYARVVQHEIDHLDGILFTTKVVGDTLNEAELDKLLEDGDAEVVEG
jgi:peptide deformylase